MSNQSTNETIQFIVIVYKNTEPQILSYYYSPSPSPTPTSSPTPTPTPTYIPTENKCKTDY